MQKQKGTSTLTGIIIILVEIVILFGGVFTYQYFALKQIKFPVASPSLSAQQILNKPFPLAGEPTTNQTANTNPTNETFNIGNHEILIRIVNKNIEITDENSGALIQKIPLNEDIFNWNSNPQIKDVVSSDNDINFDGYKDLQVLTFIPADNPGIFDFYIYDPSTGKFEKDPVLQNLVDPVFDATAKTISTDMSGGCVGMVSSRKIFSFINGGYALTQDEEKHCCPDNIMNDGNPRITIDKYNDGKIVSTKQEACPPQQ
ncbi:MAG: hypothetical protein ABSF55_00595 [Candidatus Staskawiczbacteria bacterium]|jgi:hypothetical protein